MSKVNGLDYVKLYARFHQPITNLDCGIKCAPYNEGGAPFCCDTRHAVPSAYHDEWDYLQANTDFWHLWDSPHQGENARLQTQTPPGQVLLECQGHKHCQRRYRTLTCRAFPFFPYITLDGDYIGLSFYWEYEERCWVINNLDKVETAYLREFIETYEALFQAFPVEKRAFHYHSSMMRRVFSRKKRAIPLLHRNGSAYKITPGSGRMRKINHPHFPKFGPYRIAAKLAFPDEVSEDPD